MIDSTKYESGSQQPLLGSDMRATSMDRCLDRSASSILTFLSYLGVHNYNQSIVVSVWSGVLTIIYALYFICFTVECVLGLINKFTNFFWVMCFVMMVKCAVLYVALMKIKARLCSPVFSNFLVQIEEAIHKSKLYIYITIFFNIATIVLNVVTKTMNGEKTFIDVYFYVMLATGSTVFTCYMAAVILFSVADARVAQSIMEHLIRLVEDKQMTPQVYIESLTKINKIVDESYWLDGALLACIIMNTLAAIVMLLIYNDLTQGESVIYTVSFLLYVLMIMWVTDLVFLFLIVPEIAKVNDLFIDFHRKLARAVDYHPSGSLSRSDQTEPWRNKYDIDDNDERENMTYLYLENRNNTLHLVMSEPIRYTIAGGLYLNSREFWHRVLAVIVALGVSIGRVIFLFVVSSD